MAHYSEVNCPECENPITVKVDREYYGDDADGNRGEWRYVAEIETKDCKCELTSHQEEIVEDAGIEEAR